MTASACATTRCVRAAGAGHAAQEQGAHSGAAALIVYALAAQGCAVLQARQAWLASGPGF